MQIGNVPVLMTCGHPWGRVSGSDVAYRMYCRSERWDCLRGPARHFRPWPVVPSLGETPHETKSGGVVCPCCREHRGGTGPALMPFPVISLEHLDRLPLLTSSFFSF